MSKREIVKCDRCGKEAETLEDRKALDLHEVILGTSRRSLSVYDRNSVSTYAAHAEWSKDWCVGCRIETGLAVVEKQQHKTPLTQVPTLEDMIREIVRQEKDR